MMPDVSFGPIFVVAVIFFLQHGTGPGLDPAGTWPDPTGPGPGPEKMSWNWPRPDLGQSSQRNFGG